MTIRGMCKLNQDEMAKILGVAKITVARIETGTLKLSEKLANRVEKEFGVSAGFLLANDHLAPIFTPDGTLWRPDHFEFIQGWRSDLLEIERDGTHYVNYKQDRAAIQGSEDHFIRWKMAVYMSEIHAMLDAVRGQPRQGILIYRLNRMISELRKDFTLSRATLNSYNAQISQLRKRYMQTLREKSAAEQKALSTQRIPNHASPSAGDRTSM
jgi:DNA-binding XRE family transcriptional regulator